MVIRHAKSDWSVTDLDDFKRGLNKRGNRDAPLMGKILLQKKLLPDLVISSSAVRTKLTTQKLLEQLGPKKGPVKYYQDLYHADASTILKHINLQSDELETLFFVGHNPGLTDFVNQLCHSEIENVPTTGVCVIEVNSFEKAAFGEGNLLDFFFPKQFI